MSLVFYFYKNYFKTLDYFARFVSKMGDGSLLLPWRSRLLRMAQTQSTWRSPCSRMMTSSGFWIHARPSTILNISLECASHYTLRIETGHALLNTAFFWIEVPGLINYSENRISTWEISQIMWMNSEKLQFHLKIRSVKKYFNYPTLFNNHDTNFLSYRRNSELIYIFSIRNFA